MGAGAAFEMVVVSLSALAGTGRDMGRVTFVGDFETGDLSQWNVRRKGMIQRVAPDRVQVVEAPVRRGRYACRFTVEPGDRLYHGARAEVVRFADDPLGSEVFYGWSILIPEDFPELGNWLIFAQWHDNPKGAKEGEPRNISPPVSMHYISRQFHLRCRREDTPLKTEVIWTGPGAKGRWVDWVLHVKWSLDEDGLLELWQDGRKVFEARRPTMINSGAVIPKLGIYRSDRKVPQTIYADEYRIGTSYAAVAVEPPKARQPGKRSAESAWKLAAKKLKARRGQGPLAGFGDTIREARAAAAGDMARAAELMDSAERSAEADDARETFARMASGFRAGLRFREWIVALAESGRPASLYVEFGGARVRADLVGADDGGVRARFAGNEVTVAWERMSPRQLLRLARKCAAEENEIEADRARALDDFAFAFGLKK